MARKANTLAPAPAAAHEIVPAVASRITEVQATAIGGADAENLFDLGTLIGRIEAMDFVTTVGTAAMLSVYEKVKESKAWRFLPNPESADGRHFSSIAEFCEVKLGRSYSRMRELSVNKRLIGEEAFEQAERIGLRQVDYNAIKSLPAPQQELVRRAVEEASSRDDVLNILQELAAANAAQLAEARKREAELSKKISDKDRTLEEDAKSIKALSEQIEQMRNAPIDAAAARDELIAKREQEARAAEDKVKAAVVEVRRAFTSIKTAFGDDARDIPTATRVMMRALVQRAVANLRELQEDFELGSALDEDEARAQAEAAAAFDGISDDEYPEHLREAFGLGQAQGKGQAQWPAPTDALGKGQAQGPAPTDDVVDA